MAAIHFYNRNQSAFIVGIGFITFISWFRGTAITYFPDSDAGDERFEYFKQVVRIEKLDKLLANFTDDMSGVGVALFTFCTYYCLYSIRVVYTSSMID